MLLVMLTTIFFKKMHIWMVMTILVILDFQKAQNSTFGAQSPPK